MNQIDITKNSTDLHDLEIETFEVETLSELGVDAAMEQDNVAIHLSTTSSTTSSSCG